MRVTALSISSVEATSGESKIWVKDRGPRTCDPKVASNLFNSPRSRKGLPRTSPIASSPSPSSEVRLMTSGTTPVHLILDLPHPHLHLCHPTQAGTNAELCRVQTCLQTQDLLLQFEDLLVLLILLKKPSVRHPELEIRDGCQGGPQWSPEIQSTLVWSLCWGATGSARRSTQVGE